MDDESLLRGFENGALPADGWHHREHIKVAYLLLRQYPLRVAIGHMRAGLQALNAAQGVPDALDRGYHETMTQAWMRLVDFTLHEYGPAADAEQFFNDHPELGDRNTLRLFYSRERILSAEAKTQYLPPDLHPLRNPWQVGPWFDPNAAPPVVAGLIRMQWPSLIVLFFVVLFAMPALGRRITFRSLGELMLSLLFLVLVTLPLIIAASAAVGRRSTAFWTSRQVRSIAMGFYLVLIVGIGIASRIWKDTEAGGAFVAIGIAALAGMPIVVLVWLFTRQAPGQAKQASESSTAVAAPHPLD